MRGTEGMGWVCEAHLLTTSSAASRRCNLKASFHLAKRQKLKENKRTSVLIPYFPLLVKMVTCGEKKATFSERENDFKIPRSGRAAFSLPQQVKTAGRDTVDFAPHFEIWQFCCVTCLTKNCLRKLNTFRMHSQAAA